MNQPTREPPRGPMPGGFDGPGRREPVFNLPPVVIALIALCVGIHLLSIYVLSDDQYIWLLVHGAFVPIFYSGQVPLDFVPFAGPVSYSFLHGGFTHLIINMVWLAAFGSPLANRIGVLRFLLFWGVSSLAAAGLHYVIYPMSDAPLIGASGAISAMMGAAARFGFRIDRSEGKPAFGGPVLSIPVVLRMRSTVTFLAIWMILNIVTGLSGFIPGVDSQIAWEAHIGGFVVGFFFMSAFDRPQRF